MNDTNIQRRINSVRKGLNHSIDLLKDYKRKTPKDPETRKICSKGITDKSLVDNLLNNMKTCVKEFDTDTDSNLDYDKNSDDYKKIKNILDDVPNNQEYKLYKPTKKIIKTDDTKPDSWILDPEPEEPYIKINPLFKKGLKNPSNYEFGLKLADKKVDNFCYDGIVDNKFTDTILNKIKSCISHFDKDTDPNLEFDKNNSRFKPSRELLENIPIGTPFKIYRPDKLINEDLNTLNNNNTNSPNNNKNIGKKWILDKKPDGPYILIEPIAKMGLAKKAKNYEFAIKLNDPKIDECENGIVDKSFADNILKKMESCIRKLDKDTNTDFKLKNEFKDHNRKILESIPKGKYYKLYPPEKNLNKDNSWILKSKPKDPFIPITVKSAKKPKTYDFGLKIFDSNPNNITIDDILLDRKPTPLIKSNVDRLEPLGLSANSPGMNIFETALSSPSPSVFNSYTKKMGISSAKTNIDIIPKIKHVLGKPTYTGYDHLLRTAGVPPSNAVSNIFTNVSKNSTGKNNNISRSNNSNSNKNPDSNLPNKPQNSKVSNKTLNNSNNKLASTIEALGLSSNAPASNIAITSLGSPAPSYFNSVSHTIGVPKAKINIDLSKKIPNIRVDKDRNILNSAIALAGKANFSGYDNLLRTAGIPPSDAVSNIFTNMSKNKTRKNNNLRNIRKKSVSKKTTEPIKKNKIVKKITNSIRNIKKKTRKIKGRQ